jgi:hypothetical protein
MNADNVDSMGRMTVGAVEFPDGRTQYRPATQNWQANVRALANDGISTGQVTIINSTYLTGNEQNYTLTAGTGILVMGDLDTQNFLFAWSNTPASKDIAYKDLPYVYIDGQMVGKTMGIGCMNVNNMPVEAHVGYNTKNYDTAKNNALSSAVNLYAGSYYESEKRDNAKLHGDMYLYETGGDNNVSKIWGCSNNRIERFVSNNIYKTNTDTKGYVGGNMVSNNGTLELYLENGSLTIGGDLVYTNPEGILRVNKANGKELVVEGAIVIKAALFQVDGSLTIKANGGIYIDKGTTIIGNFTVNGQSISGLDYGALGAATNGKTVSRFDDGTEESVTQTLRTAYIGTLGANFSVGEEENDAATFASLCETIMESRKDYPSDYTDELGTAPDYSLFPYAQRLDEIWEEYVRWDVWDGNKPGFESEGAALNYVNAVKADASKDPRMRESIAAGHEYFAVKKSGKSGLAKANGFEGTRYFLATHPNKTDSNGNYTNAFLKKIETFSKTAVVTDLAYVDNYAELESTYGTLGSYDYSGGAQSATESVTVFGHDKDGTEKTNTLSNVYVINKSTKLEVKSGCTYFIDPTANDYNVEKPLVLAIYNSDSSQHTFDIIVNNSAVYKKKDSSKKSQFDYTKPFPYGSESSYVSNNPNGGTGGNCDEEYAEEKHASRADVIIYFMGNSTDGTTTNDPQELHSFGNGSQMKIYPSGAYYQQSQNDGHGDISYLVNAPFPDGKNKNSWNNEKLADKYKYELLPNAIIFSRQAEYDIGAGVVWGAMIAPTSRISSQTSPPFTTYAKITYRLNKGDEPMTFSAKHTCWIGSIIAGNVNFDNWRSMVFGGNVPAYNGGKTKLITKDERYSTPSAAGDDESLGENQGKYFDNDHMAQG